MAGRNRPYAVKLGLVLGLGSAIEAGASPSLVSAERSERGTPLASEDSGACWFGGSRFQGQTAKAVLVGKGCGSRARRKDRRSVTLRDAPAGSRPLLVRWRVNGQRIG